MRVSSALEAGTVSSSHLDIFIGTWFYLCTREPRCVTDATSRLVILQVWVNQYNILNNNVPFGGKKQSGIGMILYLFDHLSHSCTSILMHSFSLVGRELGSYALEEYTSVKAVHWNFGEKLEWPL